MQPRHLFSFERAFEAADGVLNIALYPVGLAVRLQLGVTDRRADHMRATMMKEASQCRVPRHHAADAFGFH